MPNNQTLGLIVLLLATVVAIVQIVRLIAS